MDGKRELRARTRWLLEVRASDLTANAKLAAFALATYMDQDGRNAWPSQETLAKAMSVSPKRARKGLHELLQLGWIGEQRRGRGGQSYDVVRFPTFPPPRERTVNLSHLSAGATEGPERSVALDRKTGRFGPEDGSGLPAISTSTSTMISSMPEEGLTEEEYRIAAGILAGNPRMSWAPLAHRTGLSQAKATAAIARRRKEADDEAA